MHEATIQTSSLIDYRYIGNTPNNYIIFNDETWRVIGVIEGKIKIIKDQSIERYLWDNKKNNIVSSLGDYGSEDWTDSQLMYMLNSKDFELKEGYNVDGTYIRDSNNKIIYQLGCIPASAYGISYSCANQTWNLDEDALSKVEKVNWYLGGNSAHSLSAADWYSQERGIKVYEGRSIKWEGKVELMYPSDYAYTYAYGVNDTCYTNTNNCNNGNPSASWLYNNTNQWLLTAYSLGARYVYFALDTGNIYSYSAYTNLYVRPTVYLKSSIVLSGSGTSLDPYVIVE